MEKRILATAVVVLAGCATNNNWSWGKSGSTEQEFNMETAQCRAQAFSISGVSALQAALVFDNCMQGKGWQKIASR